MAERDISDAAVMAGKRFLQRLDEFGFLPESAAWVYAYDLGDWRFVVVTSAVDVVGRRKLYSAILDIFSVDDFGEELTQFDVHLASPNERWHRIIASFFSRFSGSMIIKNSIFEDGGRPMLVSAYIYRFNFPQDERAVKKRSRDFVRNARRAAEHAG